MKCTRFDSDLYPLFCWCADVQKNEMALWHEQYLTCCSEMNQWDSVMQYATQVDNQALLAECAWRLHEWEHLKLHVLPKVQVSETGAGSFCDGPSWLASSLLTVV